MINLKEISEPRQKFIVSSQSDDDVPFAPDNMNRSKKAPGQLSKLQTFIK